MNIQINESTISENESKMKIDDIGDFDIPIGTTIFTPKSNTMILSQKMKDFSEYKNDRERDFMQSQNLTI